MTTYYSRYSDGALTVVVVSGQPQDAVEIGIGNDLGEALASLQATPMQSVGPDSGEAAALRWAHGAGWISPRAALEYRGCGEEDEESS